MLQKAKVSRLVTIGLMGGALLLSPSYAIAGGAESATNSGKSSSAFPKFSAEVVTEFQIEEGTSSDDPNNERNNTFGRIEVAPTVQFTPNISVDGVLVVEPVQDGAPGEDLFVDNEGAFFEELKVNYTKDNWSVFAGKFNPGFGTAWDFRGVWGEDFAEDYEITEKLGFGGSYTMEGQKNATHTLSASTFYTDTSFLTQSKITDRGRVKKSDGGAGNTEDFSSYAVSLDGENLGGTKGLSYHLGYRHLAKGDADVIGDDEKGMAASLRYVVPVTSRVEADMLLEYADIDNFEGGLDDRTYMTASLIARIDENWNVTIAMTDRETDLNGGGEIDDNLTQVSGGYTFDNGLSLEVGFKDVEEAGVQTDTIGALARYAYDF